VDYIAACVQIKSDLVPRMRRVLHETVHRLVCALHVHTVISNLLVFTVYAYIYVRTDFLLRDSPCTSVSIRATVRMVLIM
jgi:hypothetical protein